MEGIREGHWRCLLFFFFFFFCFYLARGEASQEGAGMHCTVRPIRGERGES